MNDFLKEKELLLNSIENNTSEHWKNYYKDVPIECIYDDLVIDINEIKRLQEENIKLGIQLEDRAYQELKVAHQQLKDNWNKLKEWAKDGMKNSIHIPYECELDFEDVLDEMQELEKGNNNEL